MKTPERIFDDHKSELEKKWIDRYVELRESHGMHNAIPILLKEYASQPLTPSVSKDDIEEADPFSEKERIELMEAFPSRYNIEKTSWGYVVALGLKRILIHTKQSLSVEPDQVASSPTAS